MYEQLKNEFSQSLTKDFTPEQIRIIVFKLDTIAMNYDVARKTTELAVYEGGLPKVCETYLAVKSIAGYSKGTIDGYRLVLTNFFDTVRMDPDKVTANHIRVYLYGYQQSRKITNTSLERIRICLHTFFQWMTEEEYITKNPVNKVEKIKCEKKQKHALKPIELEYLRDACKTPRERALIEFFYSTGCRVGELVVLKRNDIDWETKEVHLFGKGKKHRVSYMNAKCEVALKDYLVGRQDNSEWLFVSERGHHQMTTAGIQHTVKNIVSRCAQLRTKCTPHVFRHTTATTALKNGMPIEEIQHLLGHENISTTTVYAEVNKGMIKLDHEKYVI